jgi:hypothetical protein
VSSSYDKLKRLIGREERKKNSQEAYQRKNPPKKPWCTDCFLNGRNPKGGYYFTECKEKGCRL